MLAMIDDRVSEYDKTLRLFWKSLMCRCSGGVSLPPISVEAVKKQNKKKEGGLIRERTAAVFSPFLNILQYVLNLPTALKILSRRLAITTSQRSRRLRASRVLFPATFIPSRLVLQEGGQLLLLSIIVQTADIGLSK